MSSSDLKWLFREDHKVIRGQTMQIDWMFQRR